MFSGSYRSGYSYLNNLKPVLEHGLLPVLRAVAFHGPWWADTFILLLLFPYLNQKHEALKTGLLMLGLTIFFAGGTMAITEGCVSQRRRLPNY